MGLGATEVVFWWQYITVFTFFKHTSSLLKKGYMMEDKQIGVPTNVAVFIDYENVYKALLEEKTNVLRLAFLKIKKMVLRTSTKSC